MNILTLRSALRSLTVFRALLADPVLFGFSDFLDCVYYSNQLDNDPEAVMDAVDAYCSFTSALYNSHRRTLGGYLSSIVNDDENIYIRSIGAGKPVSDSMKASVDRELDILQQIANLTPDELKALLPSASPLPDFDVKPVRLKETYHHRCENIGQYGYGMYSRYFMFYLSEAGQIIPVRNPDPITMDQLLGYEREKQIIRDNTLALLKGKPAANMLLTGDAGTGKSSTIKAMVNELHERGLRILEVRKEQLHQIPGILDELSENPLKFILFIDDLSFTKDDDNFSTLKAILEGSVSARSSNVVIYATSNRRHLVKESFTDRDGDDVHRNDTMQELVSLSDRFGLQVTFRRPDKKTYLEIVHYLAEEMGIEMKGEELDLEAERYVLGRGNRSARAARQFIDILLSKQ
ncbi:MAG: ATP-binding protein [Lachnospiraceae bacterium]|nr:ATP-binding protein [Lachnospiraceae bacterium]